MTALSLAELSGNRFVLGLGASGPQVVEGLHGQSFRKPLTRLREVIEIVRKACRGQRLTLKRVDCITLEICRGHHGSYTSINLGLQTVQFPLYEREVRGILGSGSSGRAGSEKPPAPCFPRGGLTVALV